MTLKELTGQHNGIVVNNGHEVIACDWSDARENSMPKVMTCFNRDIILWFPQNDEYFNCKGKYVDDVRKAMPDAENMEIVYDCNGDIDDLFSSESDPTPGFVYDLSDEDRIIAPEGWI